MNPLNLQLLPMQSFQLVKKQKKKELGEKNETHIGEQPTQSKLEHTHKQKQM